MTTLIIKTLEKLTVNKLELGIYIIDTRDPFAITKILEVNTEEKNIYVEYYHIPFNMMKYYRILGRETSPMVFQYNKRTFEWRSELKEVTPSLVGIDDYIQNVSSALPGLFAPDKIYHGERGALRLAREIGYGLKPYSEKEINDVLGTLYSRLLVKHTFGGSSGTPVSNKQFTEEVLKEIKR